MGLGAASCDGGHTSINSYAADRGLTPNTSTFDGKKADVEPAGIDSPIDTVASKTIDKDVVL